MKFAAMKCTVCGESPDTEDPRWTWRGELQHDDGGFATFARSNDREAAIRDEAAAISDASRTIQREMNNERRARTVQSLKRGSGGGA